MTAPASPASDVLTFGETMLALRCPGPLEQGGGATTAVAGAESNVAVGLARLGHRAAWAGRVGADEPGRLILRTLRGEGVDVTHAVADDSAPTGAMLRERRVADLARVHYWRAGSAASRTTPRDLEPALSDGTRVLHLTGITCALGDGPRDAVRAAAEHAHARGRTVALDVNHRARLWSRATAAGVLRPLLPYVDVLIASDDELPVVAGDPGETGGAGDEGEAARIASLLSSGVGEVVVKRGAGGAEVHGPDGLFETAAALDVPVVDTVGAGDAFCAGYLSGLLDGLGPAERLHRGTVLGGFAVATAGDWEGLPHRDELGLLDAVPGSAVR